MVGKSSREDAQMMAFQNAITEVELFDLGYVTPHVPWVAWSAARPKTRAFITKMLSNFFFILRGGIKYAKSNLNKSRRGCQYINSNDHLRIYIHQKKYSVIIQLQSPNR